MQKDYNEILMSLNIKKWCHAMGHETEDDIQDAYMVALDKLTKGIKKELIYCNVYRFFKNKYKEIDIQEISLEAFLDNNNEYETFPPTEIENFYKIDENLHYQDILYRALNYLKKKNILKDNSRIKVDYLNQNFYKELLINYCKYYDGCSMIQYVLDNDIPLSRELVSILLYWNNTKKELSLGEIAKIFNVTDDMIRILQKHAMRKFRRIIYLKIHAIASYYELFY